MNYQVMPDMAQEEYDALKEDIAERGVMIPIEFDEDGNVLDGHHRLKICGELDITDYPKVIRSGMNEAEKRTHARKLNMARRQLSREQRRELIRGQIKETPEMSDRQIAKILGVSNSTVSLARWELVNSGQVCESHTSTGADGKEYRRHKENVDKYALFTSDEIKAVRSYIKSISDIDEATQARDMLKDFAQDVSESLLDAEIRFIELSKKAKE